MSPNVRRVRPGVLPALIAATAALALTPAHARAGACDVRTFDLTISLEASPTGDDRDPYEEVIENFARAVYAASECQHRLGRVEVWSNVQGDDRADVIWRERELPMASPNGFGRPGLRMYMTDNFARPDEPGEDPTENDVELVVDRTGPALRAGDLLAHEFAHYAYGLLDEHVVLEGDVTVEPSLMNSPWTAALDEDWLNYSIAGPGEGPFQDTGQTAHHREFERSAWEVLSDAEPSLTELLLSPTPGAVAREAQGLMPPAGLPVSGETGGTDALEVVWQERCASYVIAIDNSASMAGTPLARAKESAAALAEDLTADATWLTVLTFHETALVRYGPAIVSDEPEDDPEAEDGETTERERFLDAIDAIAAVAKATSYSVGLEAALDEFGVCASPVETKALFFVSDGGNSEDGEVEGGPLDLALDAYEAAGIAAQVLNVGADADSATDLVPIASRTGGLVFGPAATVPQAGQALAEAESDLGLGETLAQGAFTLAPDSEVVVPFSSNSTNDHLRICVGAIESVTLTLRSPAAILLLPTSARESQGEDDVCSTFFTRTPPEPGGWEIIVAADTLATEPVDVVYEAFATALGETYLLDVWIANGADGQVQAPEPILLKASVWNGLPIAGARVEMSVDAGPEVPLRDDGLAPDDLANDGVYAGAASYDAAGCEGDPDACPVIVVTASNPFDGATFTTNGLLVAPERLGGVAEAPEDELVGEDFERSVTLTVTTLPAVPPGPISDTAPVSGAIEEVGDGPDRYEIDVCAVLPEFAATPEPLEVRVSGALLGMEPRLEVFLGDPDVPETPSVEATAEARAAGVSIAIEETELACGVPVFAEVSHATGGTGTYQFSAGSVLALEFGRAGPGDSPCEIARLDLERADAELELDLLSTARLLVEASRATQEDLRSAIRSLPNATGDEKKAAKRLKKSIKKSKKAEKLISKTEKKAEKDLEKALGKIPKIRKRTVKAQQKLDDACALLTAGGAGLID